MCFDSSRERVSIGVPSPPPGHWNTPQHPADSSRYRCWILEFTQKVSPRLSGQRGSPAPRGCAAPVGARRGRGGRSHGGSGAGPAARLCNRGRPRGGWTSPAPALPRTGTPPRRLLGVTPPVLLPGIFGDGPWEGGGAATPVCPRRGAAHAARVQSSAGRARARLGPPGRAAPSGDPRSPSPSRVPPGGPAVPLPFPRSRPGRPSADPLPKVTAARGSPGGGPRAGLRPPPQLAQFAALHRLLRGTCGGCGASGAQRGRGEPPRPRPRAPRYLCGAAWRACWGRASACTSCGPGPRPRHPRPSAERPPHRGL